MLCEINPLIVTPDGEVKALDSKFTVDDNALFRHPDIAEMRDTPRPIRSRAFAREKGVTYVKLDGDVGILGNGAGLSMSTVDVVVARRRPAGELLRPRRRRRRAGRRRRARGDHARRPQVRSIFFNIFGGITRCDEVARGILTALEQLTIELADRRAPRRHERRGGARRSSPTRRRRTSTSSRRCSTPRGARWSSRRDRRLERRAREAYRRPRRARQGDDLDLSSTCEPAGARRRSTSRPAAATSRGGCARRVRGRHRRSRARACGRRHRAAPSTSRSRTARFDVVVTPHRAAPLRGHRAGDRGDGARRRAIVVLVVDNAVPRATTSRRPSACATRRTCASTPRPSGELFAQARGSTVEQVRALREDASTSSRGLRAPAARARRPSACSELLGRPRRRRTRLA